MTGRDDETEVLEWRTARAERLRTSEKSWLGLAGLYWLKEGENTFGSNPKCDFVLPACAPPLAGSFLFKHGLVYLKPAPDVTITCNGGTVPTGPLQDDQKEKPDFLELQCLILVVLKRGSATLIRLWDKNNPARLQFTGLNWYPYKPEYRLEARYEGYAPYKLVKQQDIIGETHDTHMIGKVIFTWEGREYKLDAENAGDGGLFIAFHDKTCGKTSYPGGRYLLTEAPENGRVILDFNKAYNMPCAYTPYATCGLPTPDNRLPIAIEAGEMKYQDNH
ncbi:MAG: DUF1684 domain-containing protein [Anaerolineales bacterium]|nr:DUF1684 domain-containing protein [Anaerolineales bacterium]MDW8278489.1 DUF1684 domain-containing protein [Anaerolineales bacterium]